jgi:ABC-2 type transport system ATP-binding protein/lipopolysaccharide transport system ATP-binding protein
MAVVRHPAIEVDRVSLCYRVPHDKVGSIKEYAIRRLKRNLAFTDFWALRDVSFDVAPGEVFGIVGRNGAGKTTLLKIIARVLRPTDGRVVVRGLTAPLLGLGAGFNDELSGSENIFLSGATLGFSFRDMQARFDRIVDFAGLDEFIDAPLRTYSTGMRARLGFAIATDVEPDVLLLDEIMSVGDEEFRRRCKTRIEAFRRAGATVVLVSHGLEMVSNLCDRALFLDRGATKAIGPTERIISDYTATILQPGPSGASRSESDQG